MTMSIPASRRAQSSGFQRLRRLGPARWWLLARAVFALATARAAVALLPFRTAIRFGCVALKSQPWSAENCVWAIEAAARRLPWRTKCIEQGLAAQRLLRSAGFDAQLHYGARHTPDNKALQAHVWIAVDGQVMIGANEADRFGVLATYP